MRSHLEEWLAAIGSAILVVGLAVLGAYLAADVTPAGGNGKAVVFESDRIGSGANTFFFSASSSYTTAFWALVGVLAGFVIVYAVAGLMRRRKAAGVESQAPVHTLHPAEEAESRRKAA